LTAPTPEGPIKDRDLKQIIEGLPFLTACRQRPASRVIWPLLIGGEGELRRPVW